MNNQTHDGSKGCFKTCLVDAEILCVLMETSQKTLIKGVHSLNMTLNGGLLIGYNKL